MPHKIIKKIHHVSTNTTNIVIAPVSGSYAMRPKNLWHPLANISLSLTAADSATEIRRGQTQRLLEVNKRDVIDYRYNPEGTKEAIRASAILSLGEREYSATVQIPDFKRALAMSKGCLGGTGYKMGTKEKALAHVAHKAGLRRDRVYFPATATATA